MKQRKLAGIMAFVLVLCTCINAMAASYSVKWVALANGNWQAYKNGVLLKNTWVLDDECDVVGGLWYIVDENGNLVVAPLVQTGDGKYYSFNDQHDGHYGAMRTANGSYSGVGLSFNPTHDGSYGCITNAEGIAALSAKYGVKQMPYVNNSTIVVLSEVKKTSGSSDSGNTPTPTPPPVLVEYTVSFDIDGDYLSGVQVTTPSYYVSQKVKCGQYANKPADPVATASDAQKTFAGWYTSEDLRDQWSFDDPVTRDITLYAAWDFPKNYLTFTAETDNAEVGFEIESGKLYYSTDKENWTEVQPKNLVKVPLAKVGDTIYVKGKNVRTDYNRHFSITGKVAASGDITSLTNECGGDTALTDKCYQYMFFECAGLTLAPALPSTKLSEYCYCSMFYNCTGLTEAPELPAEELKPYCYCSMFYQCAALQKAPDLKAETLADYCYNNMFAECTNLSDPGSISATKLADNSCYQMFYKCTSLWIEENSRSTSYKKFFICPSTTGLENPVTEMFCYVNGGTKPNPVPVSAGNDYSFKNAPD